MGKTLKLKGLMSLHEEEGGFCSAGIVVDGNYGNDEYGKYWALDVEIFKFLTGKPPGRRGADQLDCGRVTVEITFHGEGATTTHKEDRWL